MASGPIDVAGECPFPPLEWLDMPPVEFIGVLASKFPGTSAWNIGFCQQLAWTAGRQIDKALLNISKQPNSSNDIVSCIPRTSQMLGVSDEHDARVIASYMQAGQLHAQHEQEASGTGDKGRICGRGLFDCFLAIPDNVGWWGHPLDSCTDDKVEER